MHDASGRDLNADAGCAYGSWLSDKGYTETPSPSAYETKHSPWSDRVAEYQGRELYLSRDGAYHSYNGKHGSTYLGYGIPLKVAVERWHELIDKGVC